MNFLSVTSGNLFFTVSSKSHDTENFKGKHSLGSWFQWFVQRKRVVRTGRRQIKGSVNLIAGRIIKFNLPESSPASAVMSLLSGAGQNWQFL